MRLHQTSPETTPTLPWKCPSNQVFPTLKIPFELEECPSQHIFTAPPGHLAMTPSIWHAHQEPPVRQAWWHWSFCCAQWHTVYYPAKRQGRDPCCDTHKPVSPTKPLLSPSHTFALDLSWGSTSAHPRATLTQHLQALPSPLVLNSQALLSYFCYSVCTGNAEQTWSLHYSKHKNWLCL